MLTPEQWGQIVGAWGFPIALIFLIFTTATFIFVKLIWPFYTKRRLSLDELEEQRRIRLETAEENRRDRLEADYKERHDQYIGSIDDIREAIKSSALLTQTNIEQGKAGAAAMLEILNHLRELDDRVIREVRKDIFQVRDQIIERLDGGKTFDPRDSKTRLR